MRPRATRAVRVTFVLQRMEPLQILCVICGAETARSVP